MRNLFRGTLALAAAAVALVAGGPVAVGPAAAAPAAGTLLLAPAGDAVEDSYIVVLRRDKVARSAVGSTAQRLTVGEGSQVGRVYTSALHGFEVSMDEAAARRLAADPAVEFVQQNTVVHQMDTQIGPTRELDRIDQPTWPLDGRFTYPTTAPDVRVYVIDSGVHATHVEFGGRVSPGFNVHTGGPGTSDCDGHGTHVAGIVGSATYGVAKGVTLVPVNVFGCANSVTADAVIAGVDWVTAHHNPGERAVANMSLGGGPNVALDTAINRSMADGIVYTVAAGNNASDACNFSPARVLGVITVGGTDVAAGGDHIFRPINPTNIGRCVDMYAPGFPGVLSTWITSDSAVSRLSGTSMAAPFAAGVAAVIWSLHPTQTASVITADVAHVAAQGVIPSNPGGPNRHVYLPQVIVSSLRAVNGFWNMPVTVQPAAAGGVAPYTWTASGLPPAVTINPTTGQLSGRMSGGTFTVTVTATDALGRRGSATATWFADRGCC
jgi:subtilisin family serine protease